jgi:hypothetical protein
MVVELLFAVAAATARRANEQTAMRASPLFIDVFSLVPGGAMYDAASLPCSDGDVG